MNSFQLIRRMPPLSKPLRSQRGVAILIALFAMTLMIFIALEVGYDTMVDYAVANQKINRVKAYYAAKAGIEISLLRINLYKQAVMAFGDQLQGNTSMLDPIWNFPFAWPPTMTDAKMTETDKDFMKAAVGESLMQGQYAAIIAPEGGRLDVNDLGSPSKSMRDSMRKQVLAIFENEKKNNEDFRREHSSVRFEELVNNIADYIDEDSESLNGGDESSPYGDVDDKTIKLPPNRPLRTLDELHQVAGMKDEYFELLRPRLTVFGTKGININFAPKEVLMSLHSTMTEEAANKLIARRSDPKIGGPFKSDEDLFGFLNPFGVDVRAIQEAKLPLLYDMEFNFRVTSTGLAGTVRREITAITYDYPNLTSRLSELLDKQEEQDKGTAGTTGANPGDTGKTGTGAPDDTKKKKIQAVKGRPTVVYWEEN